MSEAVFHQILKKAKEATQLEEPRIRAQMAVLSDRVKGDFFKQYEQDLRSGIRSFDE